MALTWPQTTTISRILLATSSIRYGTIDGVSGGRAAAPPLTRCYSISCCCCFFCLLFLGWSFNTTDSTTITTISQTICNSFSAPTNRIKFFFRMLPLLQVLLSLLSLFLFTVVLTILCLFIRANAKYSSGTTDINQIKAFF